MNYSVAVGMSACRHIFLPSPPTPTRCPHAWFTYLRDSVIRCFGLFWSQPRYILGFQMQYRILSACRHVGMSAWFDPPPILPTTKHDIHIVSACRHVFITAPNFLFENTKWAIVSLSACRHVGIYPPPNPTAQDIVDLSACQHGLIPLPYCRQPNMTYIWCHGVGMSACFYDNTIFFIQKYQMNNTVVVGLSAWMHLSPPPSPAPIIVG